MIHPVQGPKDRWTNEWSVGRTEGGRTEGGRTDHPIEIQEHIK